MALGFFRIGGVSRLEDPVMNLSDFFLLSDCIGVRALCHNLPIVRLATQLAR